MSAALTGGQMGKRRKSSGILQHQGSLIERLGYVRKASVEFAPFTSHIKLSPKSKAFLTAVSRGDLPTVKRILEEQKLQNSNVYYPKAKRPDDFNVNCTDQIGRTPLRIAIENENLELVELLLQYDQIHVGDALLHAIQNESIGSVVLLLSHGNKGRKLEGIFGEIPSSSFTSDITPVIMASIKDNYAIIHLLLDSGFQIPQPHDIHCMCDQCRARSRSSNSLGLSRCRLNAYRALSSPSLICLTSQDPLLTAFQLSVQLRQLAKLEVEFRVDYEKLAAQCRQFAVDLLDQVRDSYELATVLNYDPQLRYFEERQRAAWRRRSVDASSMEGVEDQADRGDSLCRLKLAIKYRQKQFIAHPSCQQFLSSIWYSAVPDYRQKPWISQILILSGIAISFPFLCIANIVLPNSKIGRLMSQPFIKFVSHSISYMIFLLLLLLACQRIDVFKLKMLHSTEISNEIGSSSTEWLIAIFVFGSVWADARALWHLGIQDYSTNLWHVLTFCINTLFLCLVFLRASIFITRNGSLPTGVPRQQWPGSDPRLVAECIFAFATVLACLKILFILTASAKTGPLQIAFGKMVVDIVKFGIVYAVVLFAFTCGLSQIYWHYANSDGGNTNPNNSSDVDKTSLLSSHFRSMFDILQSLYWGLFSLIELDKLEINGDHYITAFVGKLLFGTYTFMAVIVLINSLIAMMSDSYKKIQRQADVEWKFALAQLWLTYIEDVFTLPIPFNLVPSIKSIIKFWHGASDFYRFSIAMCQKTSFAESSEFFAEKDDKLFVEEIIFRMQERTRRYQETIRNLAKRYLIKRQENLAFLGVNEDDLMEIKQEITSFKYELLEILRYNQMKIPDFVQRYPYTSGINHGSNDTTSGIPVKEAERFQFTSEKSPASFRPISRRNSAPSRHSEVFHEPEPKLKLDDDLQFLNRLSKRRRTKSKWNDLSIDQRLFKAVIESSRRNSSDHSNDIFTISETVNLE